MLQLARLYTVMLLLELIPGATRPSTDIDNNNKNLSVRVTCFHFDAVVLNHPVSVEYSIRYSVEYSSGTMLAQP